jgi:multiple antibiotic resistance protein
MGELTSHSIAVFLAFFAIMNPVANTSLFLSLTEGDEPGVRKQVAFQSLLLAFCLVLLFCLFGKLIFEMFGITLPAFRIAGGVLVILIGFQMLHGSPSRVQHPSEEARAQSREAELSVAVSPLAMPILAGPGTLATAINFSSTSHLSDIIITVIDFALLCLLTYAFFLAGERIITFIGKSGINVVTRMMGLILAVIGTQMIIEGVHGAGF